ncbi:MAG: glycosyltransferase [Candidatus Hadarchaeum sp.]
MQCCFLNLNLESGGAERQLVQLIRHWPPDHSVLKVVLFERRGVWLDELPPGVLCYTLSSRMPSDSATRLMWALYLLPRLRRFFVENPCDAVLTFLWLPTALAAMALSRLTNPPLLIWSVQSDLELSFKLHWSGPLCRWLVRKLFPNRVSHFIAVSRGIRQGIQSLLEIPSERIIVIPNCVELDRLKKMAATSNVAMPKQDLLRLVTVGRLHQAKGMDILLHALAKLKHQSRDWECYILGDGPERLRLTQLAETLGLKGHLYFVGYAQNPYAWLRTADIFVSPSRWESFGVAIVEAMALGLPVVATATDGARDIICNGVDGLLVPVENALALAEALTNLVHNPSLRQRLGENAMQKALQFDAPLIAERYAELVKQLLRGGPCRD